MCGFDFDTFQKEKYQINIKSAKKMKWKIIIIVIDKKYNKNGFYRYRFNTSINNT